jgi:hypothetical protein
VGEVSQTVVNGAIKHYKIRAHSDIPEVTSILTTLWPFCEVTTKGCSTAVDFLIKPDEIDGFAVRMAKIPPIIEKHRVKIMIAMEDVANEAFKRKVKSCLRSGDKVIWGNNCLAIITDGNQSAIPSIRKRIEKLLNVARGDSIAQRNRVV